VRFNLIDRVVQRQPDRLIAVKNVTLAEEYLADHFPGFPILPGVFMLEALVQAARLLITGNAPLGQASSGSAKELQPQNDLRTNQDELGEEPPPAGDAKPLVLTQVRNIRYGKMVQPGQTLTVDVSIRRQDDKGWEMTGVGRVDDQVAVQGRFRMQPLTISTS